MQRTEDDLLLLQAYIRPPKEQALVLWILYEKMAWDISHVLMRKEIIAKGQTAMGESMLCAKNARLILA